MPPKAARPKTPQKKTSKPKQDVKTTKENVVEGKKQSLLDRKRESEASAQLAEDDVEPEIDASKSVNIMERFAQKKDLVLEKAIADVELEGSSASEEEEEEEEESESEQPFGLMEQPSKFIKCQDISEEGEEEEEEHEKAPQAELEDEDAFFLTFGNVPEVEELSEDESVKEEVKEEQRKASLRIGDKGKFVNPLTGQILLASATADEHIERMERMSVKSETVEETRRSKESLLSYDSKGAAEAVDEDEGKGAGHEDDDHEKFLLFMELETQKEEAARAEADTAIEDMLRQQMELLNYEQTMEFLKNLIDSCVDKAEYTDENVILRKSLDKNKLMIELRAKLDIVEKERKTTQFLNRKCAEHFRRKSAFSKMTVDYSAANHQKYYDVLKNLDEWLIKEKKFKKESVARLHECREEYAIVNEKFEYEVQRLEQLMKSTFFREKFDKLKAVVFQKVEEMSTIRNEISTDRTKLLILQHDASILRQQLTKLEDLGNGLYIKDYETLETETSALDKKVEERNTALTKLHNHLNCDIHNLAHLKEKQKMTRQLISVQKQIYNELQFEKKQIRRYITELKVRKNRYRSDIRQISFQCGLLDKPVLMRDYDRTEISMNELRISNEDLKKKADYMVQKIAQLEDMRKTEIHEESNESPQNIS